MHGNELSLRPNQGAKVFMHSHHIPTLCYVYNCTDKCGEVIYAGRKQAFMAVFDPVFLHLYCHLCLNNGVSIAVVSVSCLLVA